MMTAVYDEAGTPGEIVHWRAPDEWITRRLMEEEAELATLIWEGSGKTVNPRYIYGAYLFINAFGLLEVDGRGLYQLSERGRLFLAGDEDFLRSVDEAEGIYVILRWVRSDADRFRLTKEWGRFLRENSPYRAESTIKKTLMDRLKNLADRELIVREGRVLRLTERGQAYLARGGQPRGTSLRGQ
jgi:restriction system protein